MKALYDRHGQVYAWLDKSTGRVMDRGGQHVALIRGDNVYDYHGRHLGWWDGDHFRDQRGAVALCQSGARGLGVVPPLPALPPLPPLAALPPLPSLPELPPLRPLNLLGWAPNVPF
jgi:hypothetical protein